MKKIIYQIVLFLIPLIGYSQTESFIKVSGYSQFEIEAESIRLTIQFTESQRNEYNKIREKSIDQILKDTDVALRSLGYSSKDLIEVWPTNYNYNSHVKQVSYYLYVKDINEAIKVKNLEVKGFKATSYEYQLPDNINIDNLSLSVMALNDAKRRAEFLAGKINKKIGKIINITDASTNQYSLNTYNYRSLSNITIEYIITVAYELLD